MVRPGELRLAEWTEFDEKNRIWLIPAEKMKMRDDHEVPLSARRSLSLRAATSDRLRPLFVLHDDDVPMSDNTINKACGSWIRHWPWCDHCAHGFRSSASTLLNEEAHSTAMWWKLSSPTKRTKKRGGAARRWCGASLPRATRTRFAASTPGSLWNERVRLMQHWANRLDRLRKGVAVPLRKSA